MDFFDHQERARKDSSRLIVMFMAAVAAVVLAVYAVVYMVFASEVPALVAGRGLIVPELLGPVALGVLAIVGGGSLFKASQLGGGGTVVAERLGGRAIDPGTTDWQERRLINVVEEMAVASGVPVPAVYVMDDEHGINAFAAGYSTDTAAVAVTKGAMVKLSRDELQGVIGHEFSHVLNGDMRLNMRLLAVVFGITILSLTGRILLEGGSGRVRRKRDGHGAILILGLALLIIGWIGALAGSLIKAAISRKREFLADASAVQFTRNPRGIADALRKIGGFSTGSAMTSPRRGEVSHMYFSDGIGKALGGGMASHPPLEERIHRIDPSWNGKLPKLHDAYMSPPEPEYLALAGGGGEALSAMAGAAASPTPAAPAASAPRGGAATGGGAPPAGRAGGRTGGDGPARAGAGDRQGRGGEALLDRIGAPGPEHLDYARELLASVPEPLREAAHHPEDARALVYALLLAGEGDRDGRERAIGERDPQAVERARTLELYARQLSADARLPLLETAAASLRRQDADTRRRFRSAVEAAVRADGRTDLEEWILMGLIMRHLDDADEAERPSGHAYRSLRRVGAEACLVVAALAREGHADPGEEARAYHAGSAALELKLAAPQGPIVPMALEGALAELGRLTPPLKREVLGACATAIATDGRVTAREAELFRVVAAWMDCPAPPLLPGQRLT